MLFKLALSAGHYKYTAGKRCPKDLDLNETREWVLNDRICDKIEKILAEYDGIEVLRLDDTTGEKGIDLQERTDKANEWGADLYLGVHHNAAGEVFSGGGIVAYVYLIPSEEALEWQKALYNSVIEHTGLKGNRATPLAKKNLHEVREPKMPAVLMECGFMDSTVDCPIILTEDFANKCAKAFAKVIIERSGATKKAKASVRYRVQVGSYAKRENAEAMAEKLKADGYETYIVETEKPDEGKSETSANVTVEPQKEIFSEGDRVKVKAGATNYTGKGLASFVYERVHEIKEITGDRAVITYNGVIAAAMNVKDLYKV